MNTTTNARLARYCHLSSTLAQLDNEQLRRLMASSVDQQGWGKTEVITLDEMNVFVKRVPITVVEYANQFSTQNHYNLPTFYNYGIWSGGFGIFRELVAHIKTTNWVLAEATEHFPLLYHYRIVPWARTQRNFTEEELQSYVAYWGGNQQIETFIRARESASHQLLLFLEYFPHSVEGWLIEHPNQLSALFHQIQEVLAFLNQREILHFDCDFGNIVTDGSLICLTDFGLVLDQAYALSATERRFFDVHREYDAALLRCALGWHLFVRYQQLTASQKAEVAQLCAITDEMKFGVITMQLVANIERLYAHGYLDLDEESVALVTKQRPLILWTVNFLHELRQSSHKELPFDSATLRNLLQEATGIHG